MYRRNPAGNNRRQRSSYKQFKKGKRNIVLSLVVAAPAAVLISACAPSVAHSNLTVQCTEPLIHSDVADGGVAGTGRCALTGVGAVAGAVRAAGGGRQRRAPLVWPGGGS